MNKKMKRILLAIEIWCQSHFGLFQNSIMSTDEAMQACLHQMQSCIEEYDASYCVKRANNYKSREQE